MQIYRYPPKDSWNKLTVRPSADYSDKLPIVEEVMRNIRMRGDAAVREYTLKFDKAVVNQLQVTEQEFATGRESNQSPQLAEAIQIAAKISTISTNPRKFMQDGGNLSGSQMLAKKPADRTGRFVHSGWVRAALLDCPDAGLARTNSRMQGGSPLFAARS